LGFKAFEQGKGIGGTTGETGNDLILVEAAYLAGVALHDGVAEGYLAVTTDHDLAVAAYGYDCSHAQLLVGCGEKVAGSLPCILIWGH